MTEWHPDIPEQYKNSIVTGDARELISALPDDSVDLVVTSPPYNLGSRYSDVTPGAIQGKWSRVIQYGNYKDDMPEEKYRDWQKQMILEMWRVTKPTGAIFYNHRPRIQDGRVWHRLDLIPDDVTLRQIIVWRRPKGHNFNKGYYVPSYEWIFLLAKSRFELSDSGPGDVWEMQPATSRESYGHPAPFPVDLPLTAIRSCKIQGGVVLDPFMGSGTTAVAAIMTGLSYIGFELDPETVTRARQRIADTPMPLFAPEATQLTFDAA